MGRRAGSRDDWAWSELFVEASDPDTPAERLRALWDDPRAACRVPGSVDEATALAVRVEAVMNPSVPAEVLAAAAASGNWSLRLAVAGNPSTTAETLRFLAEGADGPLARAVACHRNCPREVSAVLALSGSSRRLPLSGGGAQPS